MYFYFLYNVPERESVYGYGSESYLCTDLPEPNPTEPNHLHMFPEFCLDSII